MYYLTRIRTIHFINVDIQGAASWRVLVMLPSKADVVAFDHAVLDTLRLADARNGNETT